MFLVGLEELSEVGVGSCWIGWSPVFGQAKDFAVKMRNEASRDSVGYVRHPGKLVLTDGPFKEGHPFLELGLHPEVLGVAENYLGTPPLLFSVQLNWSFPFAEDITGTSYLWHRDSDDSRCLKVILYLNDVSGKQGPFSYVKGTHVTKKTPVQVLGRSSDFSILEMFGGRAQEITGKAGTLVFADVGGLHKAKPVEEGERLALFLQYTTDRPRTAPRHVLLGDSCGGPASNFALGGLRA